MDNLIGQKHIQGTFNKFIENSSIPRFMVFTGVKGSGKYTLARWVTRKMKAYLVEPELSVDAVREVVKNCYKCSGDTVYIFRDADKMSAAAKNALLKVTEEPPRQAYFILTVQNAENALETLRSRATVMSMLPYTPAEKEEFLNDLLDTTHRVLDEDTRQLILSASDNLGQIARYIDMDVRELHDFCRLVIEKIGVVSGVNAFKIGQRIKIKEDGDGYEPDLFFNMLNHLLLSDILEGRGPCGHDKSCARMLKVCSKYAQELTLTGVKKDATLDMWILEMREVR